MKSIALTMLLSVFSFAQSSTPCLIVKQNKGHRIRNTFLFGAPGLFSRGERFEYVEAFNLPNSRMKYKGDELQKIKDSGVHVIVVSEGSGEEVQAARTACQTSHAAVSSASGGAQPSSAESATAAMLGLVVSTRAESAGPPHGAEIIEIIPNGPAEHAGMQVGNVINSVNDKSVATAAQFAAEMSGRAPGSEIRLDYMFKTTAMGWMATKKIITLREQK